MQGEEGKVAELNLQKTIEEVKEKAGSIIGMNLVTPQTGASGKKVRKVLIAQDVYYPGTSETREFYVSVLLNRQTGRNIIMYSTEGGMDIEEVAAKTPHLIHKEEIDPATGLQQFQARKIAFNLGLKGESFKQMIRFINALYKAYDAIDASLFEINPVLKTSDDKIIAVDSNVKAILVNIFGGIVRCDRVAQGIVDAYKNIGSIPVPIIVRLQGTNAEEAKKIIDQSGLKVYSAILLKEAADLVNVVLKKQ